MTVVSAMAGATLAHALGSRVGVASVPHATKSVVNSLDMFNQLNCMPVFSAYSRLSLVIEYYTTRGSESRFYVESRCQLTINAD